VVFSGMATELQAAANFLAAFYYNLHLGRTNNEKEQNSKSEPKLFSILCTFKQQRTLTSSG
jgi:hypothetical protein